MAAVLSHVTVSTADLGAAFAFYDAALAAIGLQRVVEVGDEEEDGAPAEAVAWGSEEQPVLWVVLGPATQRAHLAFAAPDRADVDRFHAAAVAAGGTSAAAPRRWPIYRRGRYSASVRDPDGNLIEVTAPE